MSVGLVMFLSCNDYCHREVMKEESVDMAVTEQQERTSVIRVCSSRMHVAPHGLRVCLL